MSIVSSLCPAISDQPPALIRSAAALVLSTHFFRRGRLSALGAAVVLGALGALSTNASGQGTTIVANQPMGEAKGVLPGRVVWAHDPAAVNQSCVVNTPGAAWYFPANNNQTVIDGMVSTALRNLTGKTNDSAAWAAIFQFHNAAVGKGAVNYVRGEKIFIKINATSAWSGNFNPADLTPNSDPTSPYSFVSETSVGPVLSVLRQLVNVVGADQSDIYVGDPLKHIYKHLYDAWHGEFPNVHYLDNSGSTNLGREVVVPSATATIYYSDRGTILRTDPADAVVTTDHLYTISEMADYVINLPMLKGHKRAGMTMFAKNNFGSQTRADASHLHNGLVAPTEMPLNAPQDAPRGGYGLYRIQVDLMSHSMVGKKNLVFLMDALWATDFELDLPLKWQMPPFNNTFMSSIFASLDPVAIESVGYDFLRTEFTVNRLPAAGIYVQMPGVDDYLHQAADSVNWPTGIVYDPDNTGTPIGSLGTHEHWNNASAMQYSRNLSPTGTGIELIKTTETIGVDLIADQTVVAGGTVSFTVAATGMAPLSYQWQREATGSSTWSNLSEGGAYTGTRTSTLTVNGTTAAMTGDAFRCVVSNGANPDAPSNAVALTVTTDAVFLQRLFKAVLGRDVDPGAVTSFGAALAAGRTPPEVLGDLFGSAEYNLRQVEPAIRLYYAAFARMPDYAGLQNWTNALQGTSLTLTGAADQFAASPEFTLKYGSLDNTGYVQQLYRNVLGREADPTGLANWVGQLGSGSSRGTVLVGFSESEEFKGELASQVEILRSYSLLLKRMPTSTELQNWLEFLKGHGQTDNLVAQQYPAGLADSDYVKAVFQGFLCRAADAGALSTFTAALAAGTLTHGGVVDSVLSSAEFTTYVAPVSRLYLAAFQRVPDQPGLLNWVNFARAGNSLQSMADAFAASQEFTNRYATLSNNDYVSQLYQNVLGRAADPDGLAHWTGMLASGTTRGQVLTGFSESQEGIQLFAPTLRTFLSYDAFLNAAPTQPQLAYWTNYLTTLTDQMRQTILDDPTFTTGG
jgi:hypothetical protein